MLSFVTIWRIWRKNYLPLPERLIEGDIANGQLLLRFALKFKRGVFIMDVFGDLFGNSKRSKKSDSQKSNSQSDDTFILEPILTPSGIVDGDDGSDLVIIESDIAILNDL